WRGGGGRRGAQGGMIVFGRGGLQIKNGGPSRSDSHWPIRRAVMSDAPAGGNWHDQTHWPRRIGLRPCDARHRRQRGSARSQMQKISTGTFHFEPPFTSFDHLVGAGKHRRGHVEAYRLGGAHIDHGQEHTDAPHPLALLSPRRERPSRRRAAEQRYERAAIHSMTSSAATSSLSGTVRPSILAVW